MATPPFAFLPCAGLSALPDRCLQSTLHLPPWTSLSGSVLISTPSHFHPIGWLAPSLPPCSVPALPVQTVVTCRCSLYFLIFLNLAICVHACICLTMEGMWSRCLSVMWFQGYLFLDNFKEYYDFRSIAVVWIVSKITVERLPDGWEIHKPV